MVDLLGDTAATFGDPAGFSGRAIGGMRLDKLDRKRYFVAQALNDLLAKRPIEQISVVDLCEEAGISRSTFYTYFDDIYSVGEWLWDQEFRSIFEGLGTDYGYRECCLRLYTRLKDLSGRVGAVRPMRNERDGQSFAGTQTFGALEQAVVRSLGRPLTEEEHTHLAYVSCANEAMTLAWFEDGMVIPPERIACYVAEIAPTFMVRAVGA